MRYDEFRKKMLSTLGVLALSPPFTKLTIKVLVYLKSFDLQRVRRSYDDFTSSLSLQEKTQTDKLHVFLNFNTITTNTVLQNDDTQPSSNSSNSSLSLSSPS